MKLNKTNNTTQIVSSKELLRVYSPSNCLNNASKINSVADAINLKSPSIAFFKREQGKSFTVNFMMAWLVYLNGILNLNKPMSEEQIKLCSSMIVEEFYMIKMTDLTLLFKRIISGVYGEFYERLSIDKILKFFRAYLEERYEEGSRMTQQKHNDLKSDDTFNYSNNLRRKHYIKK